MTIFFGKLVKYFLWICLFVLLGTFLFGLIKFKWNFGEYVSYLNSIGVEEIVPFDNASEISELEEELLENEILDSDISDEELSGLLEDDYFLPEAENLDSIDDSSFGFSGSLEQNVVLDTGSTDSSVSKEDLVNLIKSREK